MGVFYFLIFISGQFINYHVEKEENLVLLLFSWQIDDLQFWRTI